MDQTSTPSQTVGCNHVPWLHCVYQYVQLTPTLHGRFNSAMQQLLQVESKVRLTPSPLSVAVQQLRQAATALELWL